MSQSDNQQAEGTADEAPDGLMAAAALADEQETDEGTTIDHRADPSADTEQTDEPETLERPDWFPEKFWSEKEGPDLENIVKSYEELEKQFRAGKHKAPDSYDTKVLDDAGYASDDPVVSTYTEWAKKYGVNQTAFDELAGQITAMAGEGEQQAAASYEQEHKALGVNADAIIKSNIQWADGLTRKGIISDQEREELNIWGGTAVGQRLMQKMRGMTGDMSQIPVADVADAGVSDDDFKADISSKMADPRYGNDAKYTRDVEKMFEQRYG